MNDEKEKKSSFVEHLTELRSRLVRSIIYLFFFFIVCYFFAENIYSFLVEPYAEAVKDDDLNRYARQVIIPNFDEEGQEKLLKTKCLIVGAGGLGWPVALYATAAGFGHIEIFDHDFIEISNFRHRERSM